MLEIEIKYKVLGIPVYKKRKIPVNWMEVNPIQLTAIAEHYLGIADEFAFLAAMCSVKRKIIKRMPEYFRYKLAVSFDLWFICDVEYSQLTRSLFHLTLVDNLIQKNQIYCERNKN